MNILDKVAGRRPLSWFRPKTVRQLMVLRLAQKLGEPAATEHYAELVTGHSDETILHAYRRVRHRAHATSELGRRFHQELSAAKSRDYHGRTERLLAVKIERRSVAVAVFLGSTLDFHDVRHLSSHADKAESAAIGFVNWVISSFEIDSVALERMTNGNENRRATLNRAILSMLRTAFLPVWEVDKQELLAAFGFPGLRSRGELREVAHTILWSMFNTDTPDTHELDAAALGLHVQTERLFLY